MCKVKISVGELSLQVWQKYECPLRTVMATLNKTRIGDYEMKPLRGFAFFFALLITVLNMRAASSSSDDAFWVTFWQQPRTAFYGADENAFYQNLKEVMFARNEYDRCVNPKALDDDAQWLKEHPNVLF